MPEENEEPLLNEPLEFTKKIVAIIPEDKEDYGEPIEEPDEFPMTASMPATVVYGISASEISEWRNIRKMLTVLIIVGFAVLLVLGFVGIITYDKFVHVLDIGIKVRQV